MVKFTLIFLCMTGFLSISDCWGQAPSKAGTHSLKNHLTLSLVSTVRVPSEPAGMFVEPLQCDADDHLYLRTYSDGLPSIRKLNPKGERISIFQPTVAPDLKVDFAGYFSVAPDGDVYQLIAAHEQVTRYVLHYTADGNYKSKAKLETRFRWQPKQVAAFASGNLLVTGLEADQDINNPAMWPFTGIFSPDGTLLKEVVLQDDEDIHSAAAAGDVRFSPPEAPSNNPAVGRGAMETAADGNIYLMRWLSPAVFSVISPGGAVLRRFTVDPGDPDYMPAGMHIAGGNIAVLFFQPQLNRKLLKVVDLEGHELATYDEPLLDGKPTLGLAFACYSLNPETFTFLVTTRDQMLGLQVAQPR
jgi:hypothetical protein